MCFQKCLNLGGIFNGLEEEEEEEEEEEVTNISNEFVCWNNLALLSLNHVCPTMLVVAT